ncbi:MAG TPA: hypothetical protein VGO91_02800 [Pyrinomonadaceae bacterium]|jgi:hypothetical protein|nr:hypothetical protein [Pyrinomonadaceae bacterium]
MEANNQAQEDAGGLDASAAPEATPDPWAIGIYEGASPFQFFPHAGVANPVLTRRDVRDVAASFIADPFMIHTSDGWHMFFEVMNEGSGKGEIGLATSPDALFWTYQKIVLSEPFHLSYPYVFAWQDDYYLMPETLGARCVRLYRAVSFPSRWSYLGDLVRGLCADPSICYFAGRWWLFTCSTPTAHDTLRLHFADELRGRWFEHPQSPIVAGDVRTARPAGRILVQDNRVIRYAQDCHQRYGHQVRAFEVCELTPRDYAEKEDARSPVLSATGAGWNGKGMHHVDPHLTPEGRWLACVDGHQLP